MRTFVHALLVCLACALAAGALAACDGESSGPDPSPLQHALAGNPDPETMELSTLLQQRLTPAELDHFLAIDWAAVTGEELLADPVVQEVLATVAEHPELQRRAPTAPASPDCVTVAQAMQSGARAVAAVVVGAIGTSVIGSACPPCGVAAAIYLGRFAGDRLNLALDDALRAAADCTGGTCTDDPGCGELGATCCCHGTPRTQDKPCEFGASCGADGVCVCGHYMEACCNGAQCFDPGSWCVPCSDSGCGIAPDQTTYCQR